ncbi:MAG: hypothetical protein WC479_07290 [Candidatus Izemoplasmatales bacterium]
MATLIRTLVFEGSEKWIRATYKQSWLKAGYPVNIGLFTAKETAVTYFDDKRVIRDINEKEAENGTEKEIQKGKD